jgi:hypothetical protein
MITHLLIWVGEPDVMDGAIVVRWVACGITAGGQKGRVGGTINYTFGAALPIKQNALLNRAKAEISNTYPGVTFAPNLVAEYLSL